MIKPFMVAVGGGSGSGKTTVVRLLERNLSDLGVLVVSQDHYYLDLSHLTPEERASRNFDQPAALDLTLLRDQMQALSVGQKVRRPTYDFSTHTRLRDTEELSPHPVIFFDGILSLSDAPLLKFFDMSLYIDVPSDIRILRRLRRDVAERGRTVDSVIEQYLKTVRPMHEKYIEPTKSIATTVIPWIERDEASVAEIAAHIRQQVRSYAS